MGCCWSFFCSDDNSSQQNEPNERTQLLTDPVSNNVHAYTGINSEDVLSGNGNSLTIKTDEQSALNKILQETATNVIDVAQADSHSLVQHEYLERVRTYNSKVYQILSSQKDRLVNETKLNCILEDVPSPDQILSADLVGKDVTNLINSFATSAANAVSEIKVEHKEDLVVPFGLGLNV